MKIQNLFTSGKMNKDLDERLVPQGEYRDALNVKIANSNGSDVGAIENTLSNEQITSLSLGEDPTCIGAIADDRNKKIYWWVVSVDGSYLLEYDKIKNKAYFVLTDTRPKTQSILNLSKAHLIHSSNVLYDSDNDNVFLYWTDGINPPRVVEVEDAKKKSVNGFTEDYISVIKAPPRVEPEISLFNDATQINNLIEDKFLSFAYRYKYKFNQYSCLSPFSDYAFEAGQYDFDPRESTNLAMKNIYNSVVINMNSGSEDVIGMELYVKESTGGNLYLINTFDKEDLSIADNTTYPVLFKNDKILKAAPETLFSRVYDNVPITAKAQEVIGNRLVYANYEENYDLVDSDNIPIDIQLDMTSLKEDLQHCASTVEYRISLIAAHDTVEEVSYTKCGDTSPTTLKVSPGDDFIVCAQARPTITDPITNGTTKIHDATEDAAEWGASTSLSTCNITKGQRSLKANTDYDIGIVYYDKYGRKSTVLTSTNNNVTIANEPYYIHKIKVGISNKAPKWADRFKIAVKEYTSPYETIVSTGPVYYSSEDRKYYVRVRGREQDKVSKGTVLRVKHAYSGLSADIKLNVVDVKSYNQNEIADESAILNNNQNLQAGVYMVLEDGFLDSGPSDTAQNSLITSRSAFYVFETVNKQAFDTIYREVPGTFDIVDGLHKGTTQDQTSTQPCEIILDAYNCYSFGNGIESNKIEDLMTGDTFDIGIRVNETIEDYRVNKRVSSLTYSDVFDPTTSYNGLNVFNLSLLNYKDLDERYGKIKRVLSRDGDLISFQENKVFNILFNKNVLYTADGGATVAQNLNVFGQEVAYLGEYGISFSPTSLQTWGGRIYFADERRGNVLRLSQDGITEISDYGMRDWFSKNVSPNNDQYVVGGYDPVNDQYVLSVKDGAIEWLEDDYICEGQFEEWREDGYECLTYTTTSTTTVAPTTTTTSTTTTTTTLAPYAEILGPTVGTVGSDITLIGEDQNFTGSTWAWTGGAANGLTSKSITFNESSAGTVNYGVTIDGTYTDTHQVVWSTATPTFTCTDAGFAVSDGTTGNTIGINTDATVVAGTLNSVSPATYQTGSTTYTATITVPNGYTNAGQQITTCTDTATGVDPTTTTTTSTTTTTTSTTTTTTSTTTTTTSPPIYTQAPSLQEGVPDNPTYRVTWTDSAGTSTSNLVSQGSGISPTPKDVFINGSVSCAVDRIAPDSIADATVNVSFSRFNSNGVSQQSGASGSISTGSSINSTTNSNLTFQFTNISDGDICYVVITEQ